MKELVAIFICVVLPVAIVLITSITKINNDNKRTKVLIKAIEANNDIDADKLAEALAKPRKSALEVLNNRLLKGCIGTLGGIALLCVSLVAYGNRTSEYDTDYAAFLVFGALATAVGIGYLITYFITRKQLPHD